MRGGIRSAFAIGQMGRAMLLGVVTIAMVIPGSAVALSQSATGSHARLFTAIDLHPRGFGFSVAAATCGWQQVGYGTLGRDTRALLWRGSAASLLDLHPRGFDNSQALGTSGGQQVGFGGVATVGTHALLWHGSAASVVDLHPRERALRTQSRRASRPGLVAAHGRVSITDSEEM